MRPVKKQLKKFVLLANTSEEYEQKLNALRLVVKSEQWKTVIEILWSIKNEMASELLTNRKYTDSNESEKDRTQQVYHNINEFIDFLTNPMNWISRKGLIQTIQGRIRRPDKEKKNAR